MILVAIMVILLILLGVLFIQLFLSSPIAPINNGNVGAVTSGAPQVARPQGVLEEGNFPHTASPSNLGGAFTETVPQSTPIPILTPTLHPALSTATPIVPTATPLSASPTATLIVPTATSLSASPTATLIVPTMTPPSFSPTDTVLDDRFPRLVDETEVMAILSGLSLEQKVAQLQMIGLSGPTMDNLTRQRVTEMGVGGIIFLERNATSPEQTLALTRELQRAALELGPGLPLFIGWNHEGGNVIRRGAGLTAFPSNMALGATEQTGFAYAIGQAVGEEMRSLGVNVNFAPVLDVNTEVANPVIGLRSYGDEPISASLLGQQYLLGQQAVGVIAVAKHFPGHGGVNVDSHLALPTLNRSLEQIWQIDLPPFQKAVETNVAAVMVAHLRIPTLDNSGRPSSLSPDIVTGLLRNQLNFDGVVMTDALGMQAITDHYAPGEAAVLAILAGNDLLLSTDNQNYPEVIHNALLTAVRSGRVSEQRIDESVRRLIRLKLAYDLATPPNEPLLPNQADHQLLADETGMNAVQVLRDDAGWLPLPLSSKQVVVISPTKLNAGTVTGNQLSLIGELLNNRGISVTELFYNHESPADIAVIQNSAASLAPGVDGYVVVMWDAILRYAQFQQTAQETLVNTLLATGKPVVVVFGQLPYDSLRVPNAPTQIALFGDTHGQIEGLLDLLLQG
jgi:beta-N-acetylhexosaminidase